jgi:hypothetical protein
MSRCGLSRTCIGRPSPEKAIRSQGDRILQRLGAPTGAPYGADVGSALPILHPAIWPTLESAEATAGAPPLAAVGALNSDGGRPMDYAHPTATTSSNGTQHAVSSAFLGQENPVSPPRN